MKTLKILIPLFIVLFSFGFSQNHRFIYEYTFAKDTTNLQNTESELTVLDIGKDGSSFYSLHHKKSDSLADLNEIYEPDHTKNIFGRRKLQHQVKKYANNSEINYIFPTGTTYYNVYFDPKINWKITSETKMFNGYKVQKATSRIFERDWTVWFTNEIPISDGPVWLNGLPGLILIAEDRLGSQKFFFTGKQNLKQFNLSKTLRIHVNDKVKEEKTNREKIKKIIEGNIAATLNPTNSPGIHRYYDMNGNQVSEFEFYKTKREQHKEYLKKQNNLLWKDVLK